MHNDGFGYKNYKAKNVKRKGNTDLFIKIAAVIFSLLITVMFASIMTGGFFLNAQGKGDYVTAAAREYYGLHFGAYGTAPEAEKAASSLRARGGGGYIYRGNKFDVFAALYLNKSDAESVCTRLKNSGADCTVQRIEIPTYKFPYSSEKSSRKNVEDTLEAFNFVLEALYSVFIELDGKLINEFDAQIRLGGLKTEVARRKSVFDAMNEDTPQAIRLKAELLSLQINIGIISETSYLVENMSVEIKYYMLKIAFSYRSFANEIK